MSLLNLDALRLLLALLVVAAELFLWWGARRNGYGRTADGAFYAMVIGFAAFAFMADHESGIWGLVLALAATMALLVMALDKGELL